VLCGCDVQTSKNNRNVDSMSHALFVLPAAESAFGCTNAVYGITSGNPLGANGT
jgi:hypothetical protein